MTTHDDDDDHGDVIVGKGFLERNGNLLLTQKIHSIHQNATPHLFL